MKRGDKVLYVPSWACGDINHPDCERGRITQLSADEARVSFHDKTEARMRMPERVALSDLREA